jgi:hypothetical protein
VRLEEELEAVIRQMVVREGGATDVQTLFIG